MSSARLDTMFEGICYLEKYNGDAPLPGEFKRPAEVVESIPIDVSHRGLAPGQVLIEYVPRFFPNPTEDYLRDLLDRAPETYGWEPEYVERRRVNWGLLPPQEPNTKEQGLWERLRKLLWG